MPEYFMYDPSCGIEFFDSEEAALKCAAEGIIYYQDEGKWSDEVEQILVGRITHRAWEVNRVTKDMLDENDEYNGKWYDVDSGFDYWCEYEMVEVD